MMLKGARKHGFSTDFVDPIAHRRTHRPHLRGSISPRLGLEGALRRVVELPEIGTTRPRAGREADRGMADGALAAYRKTPTAPAEMWASSMKVALCSSRWSGAPGRLVVRRRSFNNRIVAIDSPRSVQLWSLLKDIGTASTGRNTRTTSETGMSSTFFRSFAGTCHTGSPSSESVGSLIGPSWSRTGAIGGLHRRRVAAALRAWPQSRRGLL